MGAHRVSGGGRPKPSRLALSAYRLLVRLYPRDFRMRYGAAMEQVFQDMIEDRGIPTPLIWLSVGRDAPHSLVREHLLTLIGGRSCMRRVHRPEPSSALAGVVVGLGMVLFWLAGRGFHLGRLAEVTPWAGDALLVLPCAMFVVAGFMGARRTRTFTGGMWAGIIASVVSLVVIPADYVVFHRSIGGLVAVIVIVLIAGTLALLFIGIGAYLAGRTTGRAAA